MSKTINNICCALIANQVALNSNEAIKYTTLYKHNLKAKLNLAIKELIKAERDYDKAEDYNTKAVDELYKPFYKMCNKISELGIEYFEIITYILEALQKDPKSLEGIVRKIHKNK